MKTNETTQLQCLVFIFSRIFIFLILSIPGILFNFKQEQTNVVKHDIICRYLEYLDEFKNKDTVICLLKAVHPCSCVKQNIKCHAPVTSFKHMICYLGSQALCCSMDKASSSCTYLDIRLPWIICHYLYEGPIQV